MGSWLLALFAFNLSFIIIGCGLDIEDPTPPSPPVWSQKSTPGEWPERGIDAHESGGIYLEWESSPDEDILAYNIYRAIWYDVNDSLGDYDLITRLELVSTPELNYIDKVAYQSIRYFYKLKSQDASENYSEYSDSLIYSLLHAIRSSSMNPNGIIDTLGADRLLSWTYRYSTEMEDYSITVLTEQSEAVTRVRLSPGNYIGRSESWQIPAEIELDPDHVYKWRIDAGARYVDGNETAGSESQWATFLYVGE
jgi:hypothetical protein